MDEAPSAAPVAGVPSQGAPPNVPAWPRSAQIATFFLLGVAATLLAAHSCRGLRWGSRPTELERGVVALYRIDLNRADRTELLQVPGLGNGLAGRIEEYRRQHGPFASVNDLRQVSGIGPTILERLRPWLRVQEQDIEGPADPYPVSSPSRAIRASQSTGSKVKTSDRKSTGKKEAALTELIDLNQATETELQRLPGIGARRARLIIDEREKRPFASIDELRRVPGIGPKTLQKLRPHITVESARPRRPINPELGSQRKAGGAELGRKDQKETA